MHHLQLLQAYCDIAKWAKLRGPGSTAFGEIDGYSWCMYFAKFQSNLAK